MSEFLIFTGTYANTLSGTPHFIIQIATILSATGIILVAGYMLWLTRRVFFGPLAERWQDLGDINSIETATVAILMILVFVLGIYPALLVDYINPTTVQLLSLAPGMGG